MDFMLVNRVRAAFGLRETVSAVKGSPEPTATAQPKQKRGWQRQWKRSLPGALTAKILRRARATLNKSVTRSACLLQAVCGAGYQGSPENMQAPRCAP
jgi:hypothetical protein